MAGSAPNPPKSPRDFERQAAGQARYAASWRRRLGQAALDELQAQADQDRVDLAREILAGGGDAAGRKAHLERRRTQAKATEARAKGERGRFRSPFTSGPKGPLPGGDGEV